MVSPSSFRIRGDILMISGRVPKTTAMVTNIPHRSLAILQETGGERYQTVAPDRSQRQRHRFVYRADIGFPDDIGGIFPSGKPDYPALWLLSPSDLPILRSNHSISSYGSINSGESTVGNNEKLARIDFPFFYHLLSAFLPDLYRYHFRGID
jgi:hypothetical protein